MSESNAKSKTSLCFRSAFAELDRGQISWEEYIRHCLLHYAGVKHPEDEAHWYELRELIDPDPLGFALWSWQHEAPAVDG